MDLAVRLPVPRRHAAGAAAPPALLHRTGVVLGELGAAIRQIRGIRHAGGPARPMGAAFPGRPYPLHLHTVRSPDAMRPLKC